MPNIKGAAKRHRQSEIRRDRNRAVKSSIKTQLKKVAAVAPAGDKAQTTTEVKLAQKKIDQAASKGVMHKNTASRKVSRLAHRVKTLSVGA